MKESADLYTILGWLRRNRDFFDKKDLIQQLISRFHISKEMALKYIGGLVESKMIAFNKFKLDSAEEDALMWYIASKKKDWASAQSKMDAGEKSRLARVMQLAKAYEENQFLYGKQLQELEKWKVLTYQPKKKESFGGSYARASNYPIISGQQESIKEAFGLGGEEYDAVFIGWHGGSKNVPPFPMYNVRKDNHHLNHSTVSAKTLDKLGLKYLPPPPFKGEK